MTDPLMKYMIEFFQALDLLAPADQASTRRALSKLPLTDQSLIVDAGCGTGRQSLQLLKETPSAVVATDLEAEFLKKLEQKAEALNDSDRLRIKQADMLSLPFAASTVDLIYCEGAVYNVGFEAGLEAWLPLLKPGGHLCVTEAAYTTDDPPAEVREFWEAEYPGISSPGQLKQTALGKGYELVDGFWMPGSGWEAYYTPVERRIDELSSSWASDATAAQLLDSMRAEVDLYKKHGDSYGYYFLVLRKPR